MFRYSDESTFLDSKGSELKTAIINKVEESAARSKDEQARRIMDSKFQDSSMNSAYVEEDLLPVFDECVEYDDEYDDTYDEAGIGMTEPDNITVKPLNQYRSTVAKDEYEEEEEEDENNRRDEFVQNPEAVRAQMQRKWEQKIYRRGGGPLASEFQRNRDVVGK